MKKLEFLVADWKGEGWLYRAEGSRVELSQSRKVKPESNRSSLRFEEKQQVKGVSASPVSSFSRTAIIDYDEGAKQYRWRSNSPEGRKNPYPAQLIGPRTLQWEKQFAAGITRVTIKVAGEGEWQETLEFWNGVDGWFKAQESVLKRVK